MEKHTFLQLLRHSIYIFYYVYFKKENYAIPYRGWRKGHSSNVLNCSRKGGTANEQEEYISDSRLYFSESSKINSFVQKELKLYRNIFQNFLDIFRRISIIRMLNLKYRIGSFQFV